MKHIFLFIKDLLHESFGFIIFDLSEEHMLLSLDLIMPISLMMIFVILVDVQGYFSLTFDLYAC